LPSLIPYRNGNLWGFVDSTKKIIVPAIYESVELRDDSTGLVYVEKFKSWGAFNLKGKLVIPIIYGDIESFKGYPYLFVVKNEKCGFLDLTGKIVVPLIYNDIEWDPPHDTVAASRNFRYGLLQISTNREIIPAGISEEYFDDYNGFYVFKSGSNYGVKSRSGKQIIPPVYSHVNFYDFPLIYTSSENPNVRDVYDTTGRCIIKKLNGDIQDYWDTLCLVENKNGVQLFSASGKKLISEKGKKMYVPDVYSFKTQRYFTASNYAGLSGVIDIHGREILKPIYDDVRIISLRRGTVFSVSSGDKCSLLDSLGKTIINFGDATYPTEFSEEFVLFEKNQKCGAMDYKGNIIIPTIYDLLIYSHSCYYDNDFFDPKANVFIYAENRSCGLLDSTGKKIMEPKFHAINGFINGISFVTDSTQPGFLNNVIDPTGKIFFEKGRYDSLTIHYKWEYNNNGNQVSINFNRLENKTIYSVNHSGWHGLLSNTGKEIIPDTFFSIVPYKNNLYKVYLKNKTVYTDVNGQHELHQYAIYDSTGNRLSDFYDNISPVVKNGKMGFVDGQFKILIPAEYYTGNSDSYSAIDNKYEYIMQQTPGGILDVYSSSGRKRNGLSGKVRYLKSLDRKMYLYEFSYVDLHSSSTVPLFGIMDSSGIVILPPQYRYFTIGMPSPLYFMTSDTSGKNYYFDLNGNEIRVFSNYDYVYNSKDPEKFIVRKLFDNISTRSDSVKPNKRKAYKYGLVAADGRVLIPCICDYLQSCENGNYIFMDGNNFGIMDAHGIILVPAIYQQIRPTEFPNLFEVYVKNPNPKIRYSKCLGYIDIHGTEYWEQY
jgi:hypothetical protein